MREVTKEEFDAFVDRYPPKKRLHGGIDETVPIDDRSRYDHLFYNIRDVVTPNINNPVARKKILYNPTHDEVIGNLYWINDTSPEYLDIQSRFGNS